MNALTNCLLKYLIFSISILTYLTSPYTPRIALAREMATVSQALQENW